MERGRDGKKFNMLFLDADVKRPLTSVSAIVDERNIVPAALLSAFVSLPWLRATVGTVCSATIRKDYLYEPRYMRVQHVAIAVCHKCIVAKKVVLHNKGCGQCTKSVDGGVLMCYVNTRVKTEKKKNARNVHAKRARLVDCIETLRILNM